MQLVKPDGALGSRYDLVEAFGKVKMIPATLTQAHMSEFPDWAIAPDAPDSLLGFRNVWDTSTRSWNLEPIPLTEQKQAKVEELFEAWVRKQNGGIEAAGYSIRTDPETREIVLRGALAATEDPTRKVKWFMPDGSRPELGAATVIAINDAVTDHVQACSNLFDEMATKVWACQTPASVAAVTYDVK